VQEALEPFARVEPVEDVLLLFQRQLFVGAGLDALLYPALLVRVRDVHVLDTYRA
jgi:hypothetical protein